MKLTMHPGKLMLIVVLLLFVTAPLPQVAAAGTDMETVLQNIDGLNSFTTTDFAAVMTMITEDPEKGLEKTVVRQFRRDRDDKFLILIEEPDAQRGQGYLRIDDNLWFYDPESRKFSHTSLKESFHGSDARNSDFTGSNLADDYKVTSAEEGRLGKYDVYIMDLESKNDEVTYPFLRIWVTQKPNLILKMESYSLNKRLMRTALFPSYAKVDDAYVAKHMIFIDQLVQGKKTQITLTKISVSDLPDNVFTKAYVERVNR